jgi:hypothetical protein
MVGWHYYLNTKDAFMDFEEWLKAGIESGWCGPAICFTHDGLPTSALEDIELDEGDPCVHIIRLYDDPAHKISIEDNHAPSVWRATNRGIEV